MFSVLVNLTFVACPRACNVVAPLTSKIAVLFSKRPDVNLLNADKSRISKNCEMVTTVPLGTA